jgi:tRNA (guanosine-2'-O-)-methyltransferase
MTDPNNTTDDQTIIRPVDRTANATSPQGAIKTDRFPRTSRRIRRIEGVLRHRQPTLTVVLEDVHDPHNASAVLRSCDAVGVLDIHLVYVHDTPPRKALNRTTSASAAKWIQTHVYHSVEECYATLRASGFRIFAAALREDTTDLYALDLAAPTALVFGNEQRGVTEAAANLADGTMSIPMHGMVESLNISVACAVVLYEAMRQRQEAGLYDQPQLDEAARSALRADWIGR